MPTVSVRGTHLYYEERGVGLAVLGIHGTPGSAVFWEEPASRLAAVGRCIVYDRRGFHRSAPPDPVDRLDLADHVEDAAALIEALAARPAIVIGRSTGGLIALELAVRHPNAVLALVLLEPAVVTVDDDARAWAERLRGAVLAASAQDATRASRAVFDEALGPEAWASLPADVRDLVAGLSPAVLAEIHGDGLDLSLRPRAFGLGELASLTLPTLLVSAEDSPEPLRRVVHALGDAVPAARAASVPGGHLIDAAHPVVLEFLAELGLTPA